MLLLLLLLLFLTFSVLVANPNKTTLHGGQSRSWSAEQGKENKKRKSLAAMFGQDTNFTFPKKNSGENIRGTDIMDTNSQL